MVSRTGSFFSSFLGALKFTTRMCGTGFPRDLASGSYKVWKKNIELDIILSDCKSIKSKGLVLFTSKQI